MTPNDGAAGKVLTAFLAGAMFGAFAMVEMSPGGMQSASAQGPGGSAGAPIVVQSGPGTGDATAATTGAGTQTGGTTGPQVLEVGPDGTIAGTTGTSSGSTTGTAGTATAGSSTTSTAGTGDGTTTAGGGSDAPATEGDSGSTTGDDTTSDGSSTRTGGGGVSFGEGSGGDSASGAQSGGAGGTSGCSGGASDTGVSATEIKVAATIVDDGPGASLLQPATVGMQAVINKVNSDGGICGRRIDLTTRNDSWDAARGRGYINRFIEQGMFSLLVVPSSEGLAEAIEAGDISRAGIPVVGTTGLRKVEYSDPWVFPVATSTSSIMRIMAKHAYDDGARTFGIVYDSKYRFGIEGKDAFKDFVVSGLGATLKAEIGLDPGQSKYGNEATKFNSACGNTPSERGCDMVALLLVPETAMKWKADNQGDVNGRGEQTHAAQTLFTGDFAKTCQGWCNGLIVWTGYQPPLPPADQAEGVKQYKADVSRVNSSIDATNQFVEGAYLGTQVFVTAARLCGAELTRQCIQTQLDQMDFTSDLVSGLSWRPGQHHANKTAQAFAMEATGGSFNGWTYLDTGWIRDPEL